MSERMYHVTAALLNAYRKICAVGRVECASQPPRAEVEPPPRLPPRLVLVFVLEVALGAVVMREEWREGAWTGLGRLGASVSESYRGEWEVW